MLFVLPREPKKRAGWNIAPSELVSSGVLELRANDGRSFRCFVPNAAPKFAGVLKDAHIAGLVAFHALFDACRRKGLPLSAVWSLFPVKTAFDGAFHHVFTDAAPERVQVLELSCLDMESFCEAVQFLDLNKNFHECAKKASLRP